MSAMPRKAIPKGLRFEIFKRDSFTCQYCGRKAPDVVLWIDHIHPVAADGGNDILNLLTSCEDCNSGKSDRLLSDNAVIERKRSQLESLQERKEQLEMMMEWQEGLLDMDGQVVRRLATYWERICGRELTDHGMHELQRVIHRFGAESVMSAMRESGEQCLEFSGDNKSASTDSAERAFDLVSRICRMRNVYIEKPYLKDLFYIRAILRNRLGYINPHLTLELLKELHDRKCNLEGLREHAKTVRSWTEWKNDVLSWLEDARSCQHDR